MSDEEKKVHIESWPEGSAKVEHEFKMEEPCPVAIYFTKPPANVAIHTSKETPFYVDMKMNLVAKDTIPVCIKLCEPICVDSDYKVGLQLFNLRIGEINLKGRTRLFNCPEEEKPELTCVDFHTMKPKMEFETPFTYQDLRFSPLDNKLWISEIGAPPGKSKLTFPHEGMRIDFPHPVNNIRVTLNNYGDPELYLSLYGESGLLGEFTEVVHNEVRDISISQPGITAFALKGGSNEASLIEICYSRD